MERNKADSTSLMTLASPSGHSLRPDGVMRTLDGLRMLAKVCACPSVPPPPASLVALPLPVYIRVCVVVVVVMACVRVYVLQQSSA